MHVLALPWRENIQSMRPRLYVDLDLHDLDFVGADIVYSKSNERLQAPNIKSMENHNPLVASVSSGILYLSIVWVRL